MDTEPLVENQIDDGWKLIDLLAQKGLDVTAAGWLKTGEEGRWYLYLASKEVDEKGIGVAYGEVYGVLQSMEASWLSMSEVKLIGRDNPITKDMLEIYRQHPAGIPARYRRPYSYFGNLVVDEFYLYSSPQTYFEGFDEIKRNYPSAGIFWITVGNTPPLFGTVAPYIGKINQFQFEGMEPETLMFMGPKTSSGDTLARLGFVYRPEGWNTLFNPVTRTWEEVVHVATGKKLYEVADFSSLLTTKVTA